ncbi:MAG: phosphatase PAP2 family protein [Christensenellaceae bacterium]|jgi:membrane-associated phospholipid phosphatase|nr:phosphatase PAP2 family protein [Christensenellaceae bacterium]
MKLKEQPWYDKYGHWLWALFLPLYLAAFFGVEQVVNRTSHYWVSYWPLVDDIIPFSSIFVLGYSLWYPFMVVTGLYLAFYHGNSFRRYMQFIAVSFTASLAIFLLFPNGQDLRPAVFADAGFFTRVVQAIYAIDTNTNVLPSVHVVGALAVVFAAYDCRPAFPQWLCRAYVFLAVLISISTVFIKQHSILDIFGGVLLCIPVYFLIYGKRRAQG